MRPTRQGAGIAAAAVLAGLLSGCAGPGVFAVTDVVGPPPFAPAPRVPEGTLIVYSDILVERGADDSQERRRSNYSILLPDGKPLRDINNSSGLDEMPTAVSLPPGRYSVVADALGVGRVSVPILVEDRKTTSLHLDGTAVVHDKSASEGAFVRLPAGQPIGWRATE